MKGSYRELRGVLIKDSESFRVRWRVFFDKTIRWEM
jgi:hypothetical protein